MRRAATSATSRRPRRPATPRAELAIDVFIASIRHYLGAFLLELGGADAIVFTGGIGENSARIRSGVCRDLELVRHRARPGHERRRPGRAPGLRRRLARRRSGPCPTNEEIVVARQARDLLDSGKHPWT